MKKIIWGVGFFVVLSAGAGTLIGNGRWSDGDSKINWKISEAWRGVHEGRKVFLSNRQGIKNPLFETKVVLEISEISEGEDFDSWLRRQVFNGSYTPYSVGILNGFRAEFPEPAGDPFNPRRISRFFFENPCRERQVLNVAVESLTFELADPRELLSGLNCNDPIRDSEP